MLSYEQEAVRTRLETDSTTILLRDDLEDQGALRSVVLSSTTNLQGAFYGQDATMPEGAFYGQDATMPEGAFYGQDAPVDGWMMVGGVH